MDERGEEKERTERIQKERRKDTQRQIHTLSMSSASPSGKGTAFMYSRLCLLGDFERHMTLDSALTVSRYETTGSDFLRGIQAWSSSRSFRQISKWSSPGRGNNHVHLILQFTLYYSQMKNTTTHTHTHTHT